MNDLKSIPSLIADNMEKVIVGKRNAIEKVVKSLIAGGHILIEDVPGIGKTSMVSALAKSLGLSFKRIQFTPDILPSDITGFSIYNRKIGEFEFRPGNIMSNIILADEINRTSPKTQASMLEVMEERQITVDGNTYNVPYPFMVLATQNPIEYLGTYQLPEAQLDRFLMKIAIGYPDRAQERAILQRYKQESPLESLTPVADGESIIEIQKLVKEVVVKEQVSDYIVDIVAETRRHESIELGCSPRASLALSRVAQASAFMAGRKFVLPNDVKTNVASVLSHRIILKQEARLKNISIADILGEIVSKVNVPVL